MTLLPGEIRRLQGGIVAAPVLPDPLRHGFTPRKQLAVPEAEQVVACRPCSSPVPFDKRVNPIEPPEGMGGKQCGMINQFPVLMDQREESVHQIWDFFEVWRAVMAHINGIFTVATAKLRYVRNSGVIQGPERVLVERFNAFLDADFDAIR